MREKQSPSAPGQSSLTGQGSSVTSALIPPPAEIKSCCAALYDSEWVRLLLGSSFHPGGLALTDRLGRLLHLGREMAVLDAACGQGTSAIFLAGTFGCRVVGVDLSEANLARAREAAKAEGVDSLVDFRVGDAEVLPVADDSVDAVICECAFCTFPDKPRAAAEFARVLRPGGRAGLADLTRSGPLPPELDGLLAWVACLGDARPLPQYEALLREAGFGAIVCESHDEALVEMAAGIRRTLVGAELLSKLGTARLPGADFERGKQLARAAERAARDGLLGYALMVGVRGGEAGLSPD